MHGMNSMKLLEKDYQHYMKKTEIKKCSWMFIYDMFRTWSWITIQWI